MSLNLSKYKSEWVKFKAAWDSGAATASHPDGQIPNKFVEACRASPYIGGHLLLVVVVLLGIAIFVVIV